MRESMKNISRKGTVRAAVDQHCLTFLEKTSTHAYSNKKIISGSPCTAKAREIDKQREKQSKIITVKTGEHDSNGPKAGESVQTIYKRLMKLRKAK